MEGPKNIYELMRSNVIVSSCDVLTIVGQRPAIGLLNIVGLISMYFFFLLPQNYECRHYSSTAEKAQRV